MSQFKKAPASVLFILIISGCSGTSKGLNIFVDFSDFKTNQDLKGVYVDLGFDTYFSIRLNIFDSLILFHDGYSEDGMLVCYDSKNKLSRSFISQGEGPEQVTSINSINIVEDSVVLHDVQNRNMLKFSTSELFSEKVNLSKKSVIQQDPTVSFMYASSWNNSHLISSVLDLDSTLYAVLNPDFELVKDYKTAYPEMEQHPRLSYLSPEIISIQVLGNLFKAKTRVDSNRDVLYMIHGNLNFIEVYDLNNNSLIKRVFGPEAVFPIEYTIDHSSVGFPCDDCLIGYRDIAFSENYIFALYSGKYYSDSEYWLCTEIHIFDHYFNPIHRLKLDDQISSIVYSNLENRLFGLSPFADNPLIVFNL